VTEGLTRTWRHSAFVVSAMLSVILALTAASVGCPGNGKSLAEDMMDGGGGGDEAFPPTLTAIQKNVFGAICTNCHFPGGPGPMPLTSEEVSYANLVNVPSIESPLLRVAPGDPDSSYLFHKITAAPGIVGDRMPPPPETKLTPGEIESIRKWIELGAKP
jgi:hypothetical protein